MGRSKYGRVFSLQMGSLANRKYSSQKSHVCACLEECVVVAPQTNRGYLY